MPGAVKILLFASAREAVGRATLSRSVPRDGIALEELLAGLAAEYPRLVGVLRISRVVQNGEFLARRSGRVGPGDEIAIHPPYSGG